MEQQIDAIKNSHEEEGRRRIKQIEDKLRATQDNIEISDELISGTPSDAQRKKLTEKNKSRHRAVGAMRKEIRDIEQTIQERNNEVST